MVAIAAVMLTFGTARPTGAAPLTMIASESGQRLVEQVRRCPPGYRKTMTGCTRIRPRWWELLIL
ncbi:MAG TPA: hypothetical protein PK264_21065 [Hyphomicrobiaceae bacterium]|nr:hypothetical protein [Hyphomicrobiaceae bacterium]